MVREFELLIFDLDGTLIDSSPDIVSSMNRTLHSFGLKQLTKSQIMGHVGFGSEEFIKRCLGDKKRLYKKAHDYYMTYYSVHICQRTRSYKGAIETLRTLRSADSYKMVVHSNRVGSSARRILSLLGLKSYFDEIIGDKDGFELKPSPEIIFHWLDEHRVSKNRALMIGDSAVDIDTGRKAGVKTCLAKFGYGKYHCNLSGIKADYSIDTFSEILEIA